MPLEILIAQRCPRPTILLSDHRRHTLSFTQRQRGRDASSVGGMHPLVIRRDVACSEVVAASGDIPEHWRRRTNAQRTVLRLQPSQGAAILFIATAPVWIIGLVFAASVVGSVLLGRRWATRYTRKPFEAARQSGMTRPYVRYDWRLRR